MPGRFQGPPGVEYLTARIDPSVLGAHSDFHIVAAYGVGHAIQLHDDIAHTVMRHILRDVMVVEN